MGLFTKGTVVLVNSPYSDLSRAKYRPALVVADVDYGDLLLAQITSKTFGDRNAVELTEGDFVDGGLMVVSYVRAGRLVTIEPKLIKRQLGTITEAKRKEVVEAIAAVIK